MHEEDARDRSTPDDRRTDARRPGSADATIRLAKGTVKARVENLSDGGAFLVLDAPLVVEVELGAVTGVPPRRARLVRCQSIPGGRSGWGLQFESTERED